MTNAALIVIAILLVLLNGFFVAAEFAIVKLRRTHAEQLALSRGWVGRVLHKVRNRLDAYLSACQLGITLSSLALGWIGEPAFAGLAESLLSMFGIMSPELVHSTAFIMAFALISFLHIVLGELAPKSLAIRKPEAVSLGVAVPLYAFYWLMYPFIWLLNASSNAILRMVGIDLANEEETPYSVDELKTMFAARHRHDGLGDGGSSMLVRALRFSELTVEDLKRPTTDMVMLDLADSFEENMTEAVRHRYSRYPVCDGDRDNPIGLLNVKDLLAAVHEQPGFTDLRSILRELPVLPPGVPVMRQLRRFREGQPHLAVIVDDYGSISGFVTLNHLMQSLTGSIQDEFKRVEDDWMQMPDGSYEGPGWLSLHLLEPLLGRPIKSSNVNSIGGLVIEALGRWALAGDVVRFAEFSVEVIAVNERRIERVRIRPHAIAA